MPGSKNKLIISTLIETLKYKVESSKLYDALQKMASDLNKTYEALFDGPLPAVSGKNLDLTEVPNDSFSDNVAFKNEANKFTEDQLVEKTYPEVQVKWKDKTIKGRITQTADGKILFSGNLSFDGSSWNLDDITNGAGLQFDDGAINLLQFIAGVLYKPIQIGADRIVRIGEPLSVTSAEAYEIVLAKLREIRSADSTDTKTYPLISLDADNLVSLGSSLAGSITGEGNVRIPRVITADLPTPGATRNGLIVINKTTNQLIYYTNNLAYRVVGVNP